MSDRGGGGLHAESVFLSWIGRLVNPKSTALVLAALLAAATSAMAADEAPSTLDRIEGAVVRGTQAAASGVARGVHAAASGIERGAKATARGIEKGANATARGVSKGVDAAASGVKKGADATSNAVRKTADKIEGGSAPASGSSN
jgi:hypothetical protein